MPSPILFAGSEPDHFTRNTGGFNYAAADGVHCREGVRGYFYNREFAGVYQQANTDIQIPPYTSEQQTVWLRIMVFCDLQGFDGTLNTHIGFRGENEQGAIPLSSVGCTLRNESISLDIRYGYGNGNVTVSPAVELSAGLHSIVLKMDNRIAPSGSIRPYETNLTLYVDDAEVLSITEYTSDMMTRVGVLFDSGNTGSISGIHSISEIIVSTADPRQMQLWTRVPESLRSGTDGQYAGAANDINELIADDSTYFQIHEPESEVTFNLSESDYDSQYLVGRVNHCRLARTADEPPTGVQYGTDGPAVNTAQASAMRNTFQNTYFSEQNVVPGDTSAYGFLKAVS